MNKAMAPIAIATGTIDIAWCSIFSNVSTASPKEL